MHSLLIIIQEEIAKAQEIQKQIEKVTEEEKELHNVLLKKVNGVGNILHDSVPVSDNEDNNKIERTWGTLPDMKIDSTPGKCHHHEVLAMIDGYDPKRGQKVAGHRGYYLKGPGALLNMALINYGIQFLSKESYTPVQTPYFMKKEIFQECCQLSDFEETLYKVGDDSFLIATSEQPICGYYRGEWINESELPVKFAGYSTCFRKEAGAHGKDMWGIFRIHQFEKIEQFCITTPVQFI